MFKLDIVFFFAIYGRGNYSFSIIVGNLVLQILLGCEHFCRLLAIAIDVGCWGLGHKYSLGYLEYELLTIRPLSISSQPSIWRTGYYFQSQGRTHLVCTSVITHVIQLQQSLSWYFLCSSISIYFFDVPLIEIDATSVYIKYTLTSNYLSKCTLYPKCDLSWDTSPSTPCCRWPAPWRGPPCWPASWPAPSTGCPPGSPPGIMAHVCHCKQGKSHVPSRVYSLPIIAWLEIKKIEKKG